MNTKSKQLIVVGGGAAGFFCAITAAKLNPNVQVTIVEKSGKILSKVKASGGGRCNVTHALFHIEDMSKQYPRGQHFVKKTFHQFFTIHTINWFEERRVTIKGEEDGRMFPSTNSSQTIIDCLMKEAATHNIQVVLHSEVKEISVQSSQFGVDSSTFRVLLSNAQLLSSDFICIACGGYPKTSMFQWLQNLGHSIVEPVPSLFTFNMPKHPITNLMGISVEKVRVKIEGSKLTEEGPLLITHWGLSGPAVLRLSAWGARELADRNYTFAVHINWLPQYNEQTLKEEFKKIRVRDSAKKVLGYNVGSLPNRLWQFLAHSSGVSEELRFGDITAKMENGLIKNLIDYVAEVTGKTTFKEEFVTAGGINLSEIDANTMMSKKVGNLFFAGEVLDVDGITGGFNFQHAWTSGWIAGKSIAEKTKTQVVNPSLTH